MTKSAVSWSWLVVASLVVMGCGRPPSVALAPCDGLVTLDGKPVEGWYVLFNPDPARSTRGPASVGLLDARGRFHMLAPGGRNGAVPGEHRVFLLPPGNGMPEVELSNPGAAVRLPPGYQNPESSGLVATVEAGRSNRFTFALKSDPK